MRAIFVGALFLGACTVDLDAGMLQVEPQAIELTTEIATEASVPLRVMVGATEIDNATFTLDGIPLGAMRGGDFVASGLAAGRAALRVTYGGESIDVPVHVSVHATRILPDTHVLALDALEASVEVPFAAQITPGNGARIPPNLGTIEVDFAGAAGDDVFEIHAGTEDLDIRVIGPSPHLPLSPLEWRVVRASTPNGADIMLASRSLSTADPTMSRSSSARIAIGAQPMAKRMLFSAFVTVPLVTPQTALHHYVAEDASPIAWMEPSTTVKNGDDPAWCIGCHASVSDDGSRIALATMPGVGLPARGAIIDVATKSFLSVDPTANWTSSTYDPSGLLITALSGTLTVRDGETAAVLQTLTTDGPAASPEVSPDGSLLLYGVLDPTSPSMITREIHVHPWDATTGTLGPSRVLVAPDGSGIKDPVFSNDGTWILYGHATTPAGGATDKGGLRAVRTDGTAAPIDLAIDSGDSIAGWASELTPEGAWIAIKTRRTIGGRTTSPQLWLAYFDPMSGAMSTPFHLPGQPANMTTNHAPRRLRD